MLCCMMWGSHEDIIPDWSWSISTSQVISPHLIISSTSPTSSLPHSLPTPPTLATELLIWMNPTKSCLTSETDCPRHWNNFEALIINLDTTPGDTTSCSPQGGQGRCQPIRGQRWCELTNQRPGNCEAVRGCNKTIVNPGKYENWPISRHRPQEVKWAGSCQFRILQPQQQ